MAFLARPREAKMMLELRRVIIFTSKLDEMAEFYCNVMGLEVLGREEGWVDLGAGPCRIALHAGKSVVGARPPKLAFYTADVASTRTALVKRGLAKAGPVKSTGSFDMCDCRDPDGNRFQLSSRQ
jgi:catechol 2,3-dioxygenase-like lactoylglutathione lyase family enzyme